VWVRPSLFDFELLDTTSRRFEVYYGSDGLRSRRTRPFHLEDVDRLEEVWERLRLLPMAQRHQVVRAIEETREAWFGIDGEDRAWSDAVFRRFVEDTIAGASWPKGWEWKSASAELGQKMVDAAARGELADWAELHMEILKER